jgi:hypothetical protein
MRDGLMRDGLAPLDVRQTLELSVLTITLPLW